LMLAKLIDWAIPRSIASAGVKPTGDFACRMIDPRLS
jgi:hypothetical protein